MDIVDQLISDCRRRGATQSAIAEAAGVTQGYISQREAAIDAGLGRKNARPNYDVVKRLEAFLQSLPKEARKAA